MSDSNPYAAPQFSGFQPPKAEATPGGIYRQDNLLVMHKDAELPDVCIKSNQPAYGYRLKRKLSWHHPAVFATIFLGLLIYIILAMILRKQATIYIGLSEEWIQKRRRSIIIGWSSFLGGVAIICAGIAFDTPRRELLGWAFLVGFAVAIIGGLYGLMSAQLVVPKRITNEFVWLKGVHPDFLEAQPVWDQTL